jgi:hypothetical protein
LASSARSAVCPDFNAGIGVAGTDFDARPMTDNGYKVVMANNLVM